MSDRGSGTAKELESRILELARGGRIEAIEASAVELAAAPPESPEFYEEFSVQLTKFKAKDQARDVVLLLVAEHVKREGWRALLRILPAVARFWPDRSEIREAARSTVAGLYATMPQFDEILAASRLTDEATPVDAGIKRFRGYLRLTPGQVYSHATWGDGVVVSLSIAEQKVAIDFPEEKGKSLTFAGVKNFLSYLPPSHFLARRAKEPEKLALLAEDKPAEIVKLVVQSAGGKLKQSELKKLLLVGPVVPEASWNSWWTRARGELRLDPMIDFDAKGGAHAEIALRDKPKTFQDEVSDIFFGEKADLSLRIEAVQRFDKEQKVKPDPDLLGRMLARIEEDYRIAEEDLGEGEKLEYAMLREDLVRLGAPSRKSPIPTVESVVVSFPEYARLAVFNNVEYAMRALKLLIARDGSNGVENAAELLPHAPVRLAQAVWRELDEEKHLDIAVRAMEILLERPLENPETYYWAVKSIVEANWNHLDDYFPRSRVVPELVENLDVWHDMVERPTGHDRKRVSAARAILSKVRTLLQADHFAALCKAIEELPVEQAQRLRRQVQTSVALNEVFKTAAERQIVLTRKDLEKAPAAPAEPDFHYCTARARAEKLLELARLNNEEIPANSKEIEEARQEGDLRENAGYHAAKDKQKMLMQKSLQLQQALASARVFDPGQVKTDSVGFGVRFVADNLKSGKRETFIVLGRWEANAERGVLSYLAPMMQQFLDRKAGEEVTIKHPGGGETPYRILEISNAMAGGEWDEAAKSGDGGAA